MVPQKILKSASLKMPLPALRLRQKGSEIDNYFLPNFEKKVLLSHVIYFHTNYRRTHSNAHKMRYYGSYLQRTKKCTVQFYLMFIYAPRIYSQFAGK